MDNVNFLLKYIQFDNKLHVQKILCNLNDTENSLDDIGKLCIKANNFKFYVMVDDKNIITKNMSGIVFFDYKLEDYLNTYNIVSFSLSNNNIVMVYSNREGRIYEKGKLVSNFRLISCDSNSSLVKFCCNSKTYDIPDEKYISEYGPFSLLSKYL